MQERQIARQNDEVVREHLVLLPTVPSEGKRGHAFVIHHRISRERFNGHAQIARNSPLFTSIKVLGKFGKIVDDVAAIDYRLLLEARPFRPPRFT